MVYYHTKEINNKYYVIKKFNTLNELIFYIAKHQDVFYCKEYGFSWDSYPVTMYGTKTFHNKLLNNKENVFIVKSVNSFYKINIEFYFKNILDSALFLENNSKNKHIKKYKGVFRKTPVEGISHKKHTNKHLFRTPNRHQILKQQTDPEKIYRARKRKKDGQFKIKHLWYDDCIRSRATSKSWKDSKKKRQWM